MKQVAVKPFYKEIVVPYSKSYLNRALILASLNPLPVTIHGNSEATDVVNLIKCLEKIGLHIEQTKEKIVVKNSFPLCEKKTSETIELQTYDGGTTTRFLLPLLSLGKNNYRVIATKSMLERPLTETFRIFYLMSVEHARDEKSILIKGPAVIPAHITIDCSKTTQEATAFLLAFSQSNLKISITNDQYSKSYLEITYGMLENKNQLDFYPPRDFSSMSYPLTLAALTGKVLIKDCLSLDSKQADSKLINLLLQLGFPCHFTDQGLLVSKRDNYLGFKMNCGDCLDLVPTLAFLAAYADSPSTLAHVKNLQYKESNRLSAVEDMLKTFQIKYSYDENRDELVIEGKGKLVEPTDLKVVDDHRIIMMGYLFLRKNNGGTIDHVEAVKKSFPDFFEMME